MITRIVTATALLTLLSPSVSWAEGCEGESDLCESYAVMTAFRMGVCYQMLHDNDMKHIADTLEERAKQIAGKYNRVWDTATLWGSGQQVGTTESDLKKWGCGGYLGDDWMELAEAGR